MWRRGDSGRKGAAFQILKDGHASVRDSRASVRDSPAHRLQASLYDQAPAPSLASFLSTHPPPGSLGSDIPSALPPFPQKATSSPLHVVPLP